MPRALWVREDMARSYTNFELGEHGFFHPFVSLLSTYIGARYVTSVLSFVLPIFLRRPYVGSSLPSIRTLRCGVQRTGTLVTAWQKGRLVRKRRKQTKRRGALRVPRDSRRRGHARGLSGPLRPDAPRSALLLGPRADGAALPVAPLINNDSWSSPEKLTVSLLTDIYTTSFRNAIGIGAKAFRSDYEAPVVPLALPDAPPLPRAALGEGTNGVSTNGVTATFMLLDRGTFWVLPLTFFYLPKSARVCRFTQSVKFMTSAAAPLVLTPFVRNQGSRTAASRSTAPPSSWPSCGTGS